MLSKFYKKSSGNVLFMIMIAIVLLAGLTYAMTKSDGGQVTMSEEKASIAADQLASFGLDLKRAVENIIRGGHSEVTVSFAQSRLTGYGTPDTAPETEVFNLNGGGVSFVDVPANISDGSQWEFSGFTAAPKVGDDANPDLMVVFPHLKEAVCRAYNKKAGYDIAASIPTDSGACLYDTSKRFAGTFATGGGINAMDAGTFRTPAPMACVACGSTYNAYYVLTER